VKRQRSTTESLLAIVLMLEAFLVFFAALTAFGTDLLPAGVALGGGAAFIVLLALDGRLVRYDWGVWLGWVLQAGLIALGFLLLLMFLIGAGFLALWIYCFVRGRSIDRARALVSTSSTTPMENPS
jgi:hypothetical protein